MPRTDHELLATTSVLDRLIDLEPRESRESPKSQWASIADMKQSVRRDLEWLLNTRCAIAGEEEGLDEAVRSVAFYGLPDFTAASGKDRNQQTKMKRAVEMALARFEPRFSAVKVTMEPISNLDRSLKFRIEATLNIEPNPEPVVFDTVLQLGTGNFSVSGIGA